MRLESGPGRRMRRRRPASRVRCADCFSPEKRIDCRVLLLAAGHDDPGLETWSGALLRGGIPFDTHVTLHGHRPITEAMLCDG